ncbi:MAG: penicillin-binding transpeptidase domain-containing protein, partial [Turneriella sp.]|nr:penicillin-binding transpeptidase domain-containing protein [Turneriella sp.]
MAETIRQFHLRRRLERRLTAYTIFIFIVLAVIVLRLIDLQLLRGEEFYEKSQRVIRRVVALAAPRGEFFARNYTSREKATYIVSNSSAVSLSVIPAHFPKKGELRDLVTKLERLLRYPPGSLVQKVSENRARAHEEIVLIEDLKPEQITVIADYYLTFSKLLIRPVSRRYYNLGRAAAHLTGYIGLPNQKEIAAGIRSYQYTGKNGLEAYYDALLRGEDGEIVQIKSATGDIEEQRVLRNFIPGNNLILTIDADLQLTAHRAMGDKTGALIAIRPFSGEILALVSKPDYDPNVLVALDHPERATHIRTMREEKSELNRAISTKYPPASTFKPLVALAGLEEKRLSKTDQFFCPGHFVLKSSYAGYPDTTFHDWARHGSNDLIGGIAQSCSVYFYEAGYRMGAEPIIKYSRYFRLAEKSQIDLPYEINGFVPDSTWKEKTYNTRWFDGDTINLSIGQGFIETTLIGMVGFYSAVATGGTIYKPHLVKEVRFAENDQIKYQVKPEILDQIPLSRPAVQTVREGLRAVVLRGTAAQVFRVPGIIPVAGKTGTVQTRSGDRFNKASQHG